METRSASNDQFLTFTLDGEVFALEITKVREVLEVTEVTEIPRMPEQMKGIINLRGHAVPVVDMRLKLGLSPIEHTVDTCIIILEVGSGDEGMIIGALVDSVREVSEMAETDIEAAPRMGFTVNDAWISGIGRQGDTFVIIVDVDAFFSDENRLAAEMAGAEKNKAA